jgi:hypothetical protein
MMGVLKRFLKERKLELCTEKTKIVVFNSKKRKKRNIWKWGKKEIEEVRAFKYLGFMFNKQGNYKDQIKELCRKGRRMVNKVWSLGERICRNDFKRRGILFRYLVQSVMEYGVEIWGWEEKKDLEKIMFDYVRWVYRIDFCTPRYIILKELGLEKMKIRWGIRAVRFEEKIRKKDENSIIRKCWDEKEKGERKDLYSREREKFYNRNGWSVLAIEEMRKKDINMEKELTQRERDIQMQWINSKIKEAKYNKVYKKIGMEIIKPSYMRNLNNYEHYIGDRVRALIRTRCGNMEEDNKYWLEEEKRRCVFCGEGRDNLEHYIGKCKEIKERFRELGETEEDRLKKVMNDELSEVKGKLLERIWKEKEKIYKQEVYKKKVDKM